MYKKEQKKMAEELAGQLGAVVIVGKTNAEAEEEVDVEELQAKR